MLRTLPVSATPRMRAYVKLAKLSFFDYYLCVLVVWTLLAATNRTEPRTLLLLVLFDLGCVAVVSAAVTLDDVTGFRDGSDDQNYAPADVLRNRERKPLLNGSLTVQQALRFGGATATAGGLLWTLCIVIAPHRPAAAIVATAVTMFISLQYSFGLRFSYRGGQELVILASTGLVVLIPFWLLTGQATGLVLVESYLFGLWSLLISAYSNINDIEGDRAAGRRNLATRLTPDRYRRLIAVLTLTELGAVLIGPLTGAAPWWFGLFLLPVLALRVRQMILGLLRDQPLAARKLGITIHRTGVVALLVANLLVVSAR